MHKRVNTMNGLYNNGKRLKNIKLIPNTQQNTIQNNETENNQSDSLSGTNNIMYLATNDVQSGDYYQQNSRQGNAINSMKRGGGAKKKQFDDSTMSKIGVYAAANVRR